MKKWAFLFWKNVEKYVDMVQLKLYNKDKLKIVDERK